MSDQERLGSQPVADAPAAPSTLNDTELRRQPPFRPIGACTDERPHPNAEALINAGAMHVFPGDAPAQRTDGAGGDVDKSNTTGGRGDGRRDEAPIVGGTPLDEMRDIDEPEDEGGDGGDDGGRAGPLDERKRHDSLATLHAPSRQETSKPTPVRSHTLLGSQPELEYGVADAGAGRAGPAGTASRPKVSARAGSLDMADMGSIRMGTSALISALNALPWGDEDASSSSGDDEDAPAAADDRMGKSVMFERPARPTVNRLHSSLHTIRPMDGQLTAEDEVRARRPRVRARLSFPFRENTIARHARSPGRNELDYQYARERGASQTSAEGGDATSEGDVPPPRPPTQASTSSSPSRRSTHTRQSSGDSSIGLPASPSTRALVARQVEREELLGGEEELTEKVRAQAAAEVALEPVLSPAAVEAAAADDNTAAALREGGEASDIVEEHMMANESERKRLRKEKLAERLQDVFGLEEREEVLEEMRCWLLRSVMLKGYMYITPRHICFFAHMPDKENAVVKTGPLSKKASRTKLSTKYWVVLRNDVLSWYESTNDPYFPKGNVSLQYASSCDPVDETRFKLRTSERTYTFSAETQQSRDDWVRAIEKVMFKTQHEGESVKLIIPLEAVDEVERSPTLEFAETIEIRVVDPEDAMSVDSYFFASFHDNDYALAAIQRALDNRQTTGLPRVPSVLTPEAIDDAQSVAPQPGSSGTSLPHLGLGKIGNVIRSYMPKNSDDSMPPSSEARTALTTPLRKKTTGSARTSVETDRATLSPSEPESDADDGYPPRQCGPPPPGMEQQAGGTSWTSLIKKPLKPAAKLFGSSTSLPQGRSSTDPEQRRRVRKKSSVHEIVEQSAMASDDESDENADADADARRGQRSRHGETARLSFSSAASGRSGRGARGGYEVMEQSETGRREDEETARKFRSVFALGDKEELIDHFPGYLYRVLPVAGRFFVSTNYFCFRSSQLLYKTKMIIPIRDLYGLKAQKAFRFGHSGLIIVIKGHEELFLEFSSARRRKACIALLEQRMEEVRVRAEGGAGADDSDLDERIESRVMEDLDESAPPELRRDPAAAAAASGPSPLFGSTTSTFIEFKPEPMRITCLTIGSRGDVQPYIALCKGLQAEGHTTRIATHGEYKDWVEGHGIEFASVGGDPAELMKMCVDNGMFTVSFLKEGIQKFRGWLDDLLNSSWEACQGSDLLIESPSAMAGMHIAEALRIPYMRAFTMPWTRTRAYPHAFAVPEHKKGGSYNYMTYTMFDQVFWRAISGQINRWRRKVLAIDSTNFDKLEQHKVPFLYNFSPAIVPPPLDWTEWIHVTGYWFLENADESAAKEKKWTPPEGLVEFIDGAHEKGKKVVYIGFGSIVVSDPQEMTRCVVDAVVDAGVCAILSKGWSDRGSKDKGEGDSKDEADGIKYPPEIYSIDSIDHSWLFPRIDAACHHGGAGTSGASFRAGIPTIIKPFFGDQAFWAERAESLGVGSAIRKLTAESLSAALKTATTDQKQITKARVIGETIRKENGVARAIEAIYRDLEYAKSIVKPPPAAAGADAGGPLDKVSTTLLHPLKSVMSPSSDAAGDSRPRTGSHSSHRLAFPRRSSGHSTHSTHSAHSTRSTHSTHSAGSSAAPPRARARSDDSPARKDSEAGMTSDDSWAVLSDSERAGDDARRSEDAGPRGGGDAAEDDKAGRRKSIAALGSLVGHLLPARPKDRHAD